MMMENIFKKEFTVGLDIGSSSVKMAKFVEAQDTDTRLSKSDIKEYKISDGAASDEEILSAVKNLIRPVDIRKSACIAVINCQDTAMKKIITPYMTMSELRNGIKLQAKSYFAFPVEESVLDFTILGDLVEKGVRKYEVLVAASPVKTVNKYISILNKAGVSPAAFLPASYALYKMAERLASVSGECICVSDIGFHYTEVVIIKGKELLFVRKIPVGGENFTGALTDTIMSEKGAVKLSREEAENIKRSVGIPAENNPDVIEGKISASQVLGLLRSPLDQLSSEFERCFDYYREEHNGGKIDRMVICGGGSALSGLEKYLSENLDVEVRIAGNPEGIDIEKYATEDSARLSHRTCLAFSAALCRNRGLNILPAEIKDKAKATIKRGTIEVLTVTLALIFVFVYIGMRIQLINLQKRIDVAKMELSSMRSKLDAAGTRILASAILADEPQWEDVLKEMSNIIPDSMHITSFSMDNRAMALEGIIGSEDGEQVLTDFINTMESGIFHNVKLVNSSELQDKKGVAFELKCWVDYEDS